MKIKMQIHSSKHFALLALAALFICQHAMALTFKSDGSVVQSSGKVVTKSYADRFKEQFSNPDKNNWAFSDDKGENPKGYFGNDVLLPGTPLLRISKIQKGEDYMVSLADKNGFAGKESLQRFIIANASPEFLEELGLKEEQAISYVAAGVAQAENLGEQYSKMVSELKEVSLSISMDIANTVADEVEKSIETQIEDSISEQIEESLDNWLDALLEKYSIDPSWVSEIGDGWVAIDCNAAGDFCSQ